MKIFISNLVLTLLICSCGYSDKDFNFNNTDLEYISAFHEGDMLLFENTKHETEEFLVVAIDSNQKKKTAYLASVPAYNQVFVIIEQLLTPGDSAEIEEGDDEPLLTISKHPQQKETVFSFRFKNLYAYHEKNLGTLYADTVLNGNHITDFYIIKNDDPEADTAGTGIRELYWSKEQGLLGYRLWNGIAFTRKDNID